MSTKRVTFNCLWCKRTHDRAVRGARKTDKDTLKTYFKNAGKSGPYADRFLDANGQPNFKTRCSRTGKNIYIWLI